MPPEGKEKVQEAADWLLRQSGFAGQTIRYQEIAGELATTYTKNEESFNRARENAYKDARDRVSQVLLKGAAEIQRSGQAESGREPGGQHADNAGGSQRSPASVARDVWQGAFRAVERERQMAEARGRLAKMRELRKREIKEHQYLQGYCQNQEEGYER
jgi:hypothetical protein